MFKHNFFVTVVLFLILSFSMILLFIVKYYSRVERKVLHQIDSAIKQTREHIHVLEAELTYLKRPENIVKIVEDSLKLQNLSSADVKYIKKKECFLEDYDSEEKEY